MEKTIRAFAYLRLSKDDPASTSVARQREAVERLCKDRGWELLDTFSDIDVSGYDGKRRPGLDKMLARLGEVGAVVVYRIDRLARSAPQFSRILEKFHEHRVEFAATDMQVDSSPAGTLVRDLVARLAQFESDQLSERSLAMHAYKRKNGEPVGRTPYGWRKNGKGWEPDPKEQKVLATAARRFVSGETMSAIAQDLGFPDASLSRLLQSPRVQEALPNDVDIASAFAARKRARIKTNTRSLLGGLARCGVCGRGMTSGSTKAKRSGRWSSYACPDSHVAIAAPFLDQLVSDQVIGAVDSGKLADAIRRKTKVKTSRRVSEIETRLEVLEADHYDGKLPRVRFERHRERLLADLGAAQEAERENGIDLPLDLAYDLAGRWDTLSLLARRQIISACLSSITVAKAKKPSPRVDPSRVELIWRG